MKLLKLELTNFQGIKALKLDFNGTNSSVYGNNASGKTTVYNALTWLLTDNPSTGAKGYTPKTNSESGEVHNAHHSAVASFRCDDGRIVTFSKDYHEVYQKKRNSLTEELTGHTTDYAVDGVPCGEAQYQKAVVRYVGGTVEQIRMLLMPLYFTEAMSWQKRREILLEIAGDVSDEDVIASLPALKDLPKYLAVPGADGQMYSVDEYAKIAAEKKKKINQGLASLPARIDEARKAIPDLTGLDEETIEIGIESLEKRRTQIMEAKAQSVGQDTATAEYRLLLAEAKTKLSEARSRHSDKAAKVNDSVLAALAAARKELSGMGGDLVSEEFGITSAERKIADLERRRKDLVEQYKKESEVAWDDARSICPTCRRPLPEEQIESMKAEFNLARSRRLEEINQQGQRECSQGMIDAQKAALTEHRAKEQAIKARMDEQRIKIKELQQQVKETEPFKSTALYKELAAAIAGYESGQNDASEKARALTSEKDQQIAAINEELRAARTNLQKFDIKRTQEKRATELETAEKDLGAEYEAVERGLYLCETFIKQKVSLLDEKINQKFKNVRFRLFIKQINGGLKEDCEVLVPSPDGRMVPFANANNAARINAALEIVEILADHWQIELPVFVDNAESVTDLYCSERLQIVRLVVSKLHPLLTLYRDGDPEGDMMAQLMALGKARLQQLLQMAA